ncbi:YcxB family protein [Streptomyces sp. NPDC020807]|uniref:YcxB family protein n=1 Tax=Streptomyces sp. NPDC020807 TaxID=3155119 RepID=UPI003410A3FF
MGETTTDAIHLTYPAAFADIREAVRIRMRALLWWRLTLWIARVTVGFVVLLVGLVSLASGTPDADVSIKMAAACVVLLVLPGATMWATARAYFVAVRGQGEITCVVDEDGGRWSSRDTETTVRWGLMPRYVETPRLFVLLTAKGSGSGFAYLPKHGLPDPADVDRLRAVLDRNIEKA